MTQLLETRAGRVVLWLVGAGVVVGLTLAVGRTLPTQPMIGITAALVVLALGITAAQPAAVPLLTRNSRYFSWSRCTASSAPGRK